MFKKKNQNQNYQPDFQQNPNAPYPPQYPQQYQQNYPQQGYPQQGYPQQYPPYQQPPYGQQMYPGQQDNRNKSIEKEVKKIFGSETRILLGQIIISLLCFIFLAFVIVTRFLGTQFPSEKANKFFSNNEYNYGLLIFPIALAILFFFSFIKCVIDRGATKKAIKIFREQLQANSTVFTMPGVLPNIVKKLTLKQVTRSWIAAYFVTAGLIFASVLFFLSTQPTQVADTAGKKILQGIQELVANFLTKHFQNPQLVGGLMYAGVAVVFVLGLLNYLVIRKRLANIDAVFGQVYRREIDIDRIRSKRHFICFIIYACLILFPIIFIVILWRRKRGKK
ncbi:hypothetical protein HF996_03425 [Mycoplasma sp. 1654_15]|nr:hypothetical protein HF996_03425 [Mycoplasma sp. 1654_15]